ncbi:MAG: protein kinase [Myxococcales bacterium]|nr:protein kinase [Myxococcales bacterium]
MALNVIGKTLAGFRVTAKLGEGAMATVYRGENRLDPGIVRALKVIRPELTASEEFVARFTQEARTLDGLAHANIVKFYGVRREEGLLIMELELLEGAASSKVLERLGQPMPPKTAFDWLLQAVAGVSFAHELGVVHRDLKPDNIFVTVGGVVKILDFGLAIAVDDVERQRQLTVKGTVAGSPAYMAPEVCNGEKPTAAADVYALAMSAYEMMLGHHPLLPPGADAKSATQLMFAQVTTVLPPIRDVRPEVPVALSNVLARALAKDPRRRFTNAPALQAALWQCRAEDGKLAGVPRSPSRGDLRDSQPRPPDHPGSQSARTRPATARTSAQAASVQPPAPPEFRAPPEKRLNTRFALPTLGEANPASAAAAIDNRAPLPPFGGRGADVPKARASATYSRGSGWASHRTRWLVAGGVAAALSIGLALYLRGSPSSTPPPPRPGVEATLPDTGSAAPDVRQPLNNWIRIAPPTTEVRLGVDKATSGQPGFRPARGITAPIQPFEILQHEVTWAEIDEWLQARDATTAADVLEPGPSSAEERRVIPASGITWRAAANYCRFVAGRLPTEEEWEWAARSPDGRPAPWGSKALDLLQVSAYAGENATAARIMSSDMDVVITESGAKVYDLIGNVQEWTSDLWREDAPGGDEEEWVQSGELSFRAIRGLPLRSNPPARLPSTAAAHREILCATGSCLEKARAVLKGVGFRCVRDVTSR